MAVAILISCSAPVAGQLPAGAVHVQRAEIVDATGFEAPMAASTLFLPPGWSTQGGVLWGQQYACTNGYVFNWTAVAPDGRTSITVLPQQRWEANNYGAGPSTPGCRSAPYTNVRQYLESLAQGWRPGARALDYRVRDDLQREFAQFNAATPMPLGEQRTWVEAGEILIAYDDRGADMRATVAAVGIFSLSRTNAGSGLPVMDAFTGYVLPAYAVAAPNGRLELGFFEAIRRSMKANPQWEARIANHNYALARVAIEENAKRAAIITQSNAEIARIREEAWSAYTESSDRRAREFGELLRGVETYNDADAPGGQAELSNLYNNAWRLDDGSYVLTNDASFEPFRDVGVAGRRLEATR
jgi:hypothetical protein